MAHRLRLALLPQLLFSHFALLFLLKMVLSQRFLEQACYLVDLLLAC